MRNFNLITAIDAKLKAAGLEISGVDGGSESPRATFPSKPNKADEDAAKAIIEAALADPDTLKAEFELEQAKANLTGAQLAQILIDIGLLTQKQVDDALK